MYNILHISSAITWRGGEQQLAYMAESLNNLNTQQVFFCQKNSALEEYCKQNNIKHYTIKKSKGLGFKWARKIKQICKQENINIIHCHDSKSHTYSILSYEFYHNRIPIVLHRKVIFKLKKSLFTRYKYNHKSVKKIICISHAVENEVNEIVKKQVTTVIYSSVRPNRTNDHTVDYRKQYGVPKDHKIIVYIAALTYEKDHLTFLNTAVELLKINKKLTFFLIGEGKLKHKITNKIDDLNLNENVILTGFLKDIKTSIHQFDVLLFTSKLEGLGSTILDFFIAKVPVVSTACGGCEEIIKNNFTGLLCAKEDVTCLTNSILKVISNDEFKNKIVQNAYEHVINHHDILKMGKKIKNVYNYIYEK